MMKVNPNGYVIEQKIALKGKPELQNETQDELKVTMSMEELQDELEKFANKPKEPREPTKSMDNVNDCLDKQGRSQVEALEREAQIGIEEQIGSMNEVVEIRLAVKAAEEAECTAEGTVQAIDEAKLHAAKESWMEWSSQQM
eukprot:955099-Ditylum_brightwellii.AAC.1